MHFGFVRKVTVLLGTINKNAALVGSYLAFFGCLLIFAIQLALVPQLFQDLAARCLEYRGQSGNITLLLEAVSSSGLLSLAFVAVLLTRLAKGRLVTVATRKYALLLTSSMWLIAVAVSVLMGWLESLGKPQQPGKSSRQ